MTITELTPERLRAQAREAAEQHIPLEEANHHEPGTKLWRQFNGAYYSACRERDRADAFRRRPHAAMLKIIARGIALTHVSIGGGNQ